jgi:hypothetical protein
LKGNGVRREADRLGEFIAINIVEAPDTGAKYLGSNESSNPPVMCTTPDPAKSIIPEPKNLFASSVKAERKPDELQIECTTTG